MASLPASVSIVIPVYNDSKGIQTTLDSILDATNSEVKIIVVDNNSTDKTPAIVQRYRDDHPHVKHLIERDVQSSYAARNTGILKTNSEFIIFIDADMTVPAGWLSKLIDSLEDSETYYMGCNVELTLPENPTIASRYDQHTGFPVEQYIEAQHFAPTSCLIVRRSVFEDVGLFDARLISAGDKEFGNRVYDAGYDLNFVEDVTVYHPTRNTISDLVSKDLRVGRGLCQLQRYHPIRFGRPGIPPRPSGAKSPKSSIPIKDRVTFGSLGTILTGIRALGYYSELVSPTDAPDINEIPKLD